jgi:hypothetical protein
MPERRRCPNCAAPMSANDAQSVCPACLSPDRSTGWIRKPAVPCRDAPAPQSGDEIETKSKDCAQFDSQAAARAIRVGETLNELFMSGLIGVSLFFCKK